MDGEDLVEPVLHGRGGGRCTRPPGQVVEVLRQELLGRARLDVRPHCLSRMHCHRRINRAGNYLENLGTERIGKEKPEYDGWDPRVSWCGGGELKEVLGFIE